MSHTAIVLAGGLGTRLRSMVSDLPKPMAPVAGMPFLHYIFVYLQKQGVTRALLSVGYKHESIQDFLGDRYLGIEVLYSIEEEPLGTGGGIKRAFSLLQEDVFILNGDTFFDVNLNSLKIFADKKKSLLALSLKSLIKFDRYGTVELDAKKRIVHFDEKKWCDEGLINGGVYFARKNLFDEVETPLKFSFEQEVLEKQVSKLFFHGYESDSYFIDIGIPEDYQRAQQDFKKA